MLDFSHFLTFFSLFSYNGYISETKKKKKKKKKKMMYLLKYNTVSNIKTIFECFTPDFTKKPKMAYIGSNFSSKQDFSQNVIAYS